MSLSPRPATPHDLALRTELRPGDVGTIVQRHGLLYAREHGFDPTFEAYVAGPLAEFVRRASPRERLWIAENAAGFAGCVAIVEGESAGWAQLRWFLVEPEARGLGLGRRLLDEAISFSRAQGYAGIVLWTVEALKAAARLYRAAGFARVEARPERLWGVDVVEERYELRLDR